MRSLVLGLLTGLAVAAAAQERPGTDHSPHSDHSQHIRKARVAALSEQMNQPAPALRQGCRFESDIATAPPAGLVHLSFDDGPEPGATEHILALLARHEVPATFFLIGAKAGRHPELLAKLRGHPFARVGSHSWSHPNFHQIDSAHQQDEILRSDAALAEAEAGKLFRYPFGNASCASNEQLADLGYRIVGWHVDSCDWAFDKTGSIDAHEAKICGVAKQHREQFIEHVVAAVKARHGGIVLLHEIHPNTLAQLDTLILRLKQEGFAFAPLAHPGFTASLR